MHVPGICSSVEFSDNRQPQRDHLLLRHTDMVAAGFPATRVLLADRFRRFSELSNDRRAASPRRRLLGADFGTVVENRTTDLHLGPSRQFAVDLAPSASPPHQTST